MKYLSLFLLFAIIAPSPIFADPEGPRPDKIEKPASAKPERKTFPKHWGPPPRIQTKDLRPLPGGFGRGSSTLAAWIAEHLKEDIKKGLIPKRPKPSPQIQEKIGLLRAQRELLKEAHKDLHSELQGKTKEEVQDLIKNFRQANKERHHAIKVAHHDLIKTLRDKAQEGLRRE